MSASSALRENARRFVSRFGAATSVVLTTLANRDESEGALGRHGVMLASMIVLLVALPLGQAIVGEAPEFPVFLALVLISAVFVSSHQRWIFFVAAVIGAASVGGIAYAEYFDSHSIRIVSEILGLSLLGFTTLVMFNSLVQADNVSQDTIVGGVCVFLLIGLCFTMVFILVTDFAPGSFVEGDHPLVRSASDSSAHATTLLYYSFVTLTTLGYGDVAPRGDMARMFAVSEALIGQLYLVVFLARLVALYLWRARESLR
jgi:voltage-gated potassium channel